LAGHLPIKGEREVVRGPDEGLERGWRRRVLMKQPEPVPATRLPLSVKRLCHLPSSEEHDGDDDVEPMMLSKIEIATATATGDRPCLNTT